MFGSTIQEFELSSQSHQVLDWKDILRPTNQKSCDLRILPSRSQLSDSIIKSSQMASESVIKPLVNLIEAKYLTNNADLGGLTDYRVISM